MLFQEKDCIELPMDFDKMRKKLESLPDCVLHDLQKAIQLVSYERFFVLSTVLEKEIRLLYQFFNCSRYRYYWSSV